MNVAWVPVRAISGSHVDVACRYASSVQQSSRSYSRNLIAPPVGFRSPGSGFNLWLIPRCAQMRLQEPAKQETNALFQSSSPAECSSCSAKSHKHDSRAVVAHARPARQHPPQVAEDTLLSHSALPSLCTD